MGRGAASAPRCWDKAAAGTHPTSPVRERSSRREPDRVRGATTPARSRPSPQPSPEGRGCPRRSCTRPSSQGPRSGARESRAADDVRSCHLGVSGFRVRLRRPGTTAWRLLSPVRGYASRSARADRVSGATSPKDLSPHPRPSPERAGGPSLIFARAETRPSARSSVQSVRSGRRARADGAEHVAAGLLVHLGLEGDLSLRPTRLRRRRAALISSTSRLTLGNFAQASRRG